MMLTARAMADAHDSYWAGPVLFFRKSDLHIMKDIIMFVLQNDSFLIISELNSLLCT